MTQDLLHYFGVIALVVAALLPIVDPLGSAPIFIAMTPGADRQTRAWLAGRVPAFAPAATSPTVVSPPK